MLNNHDTKMITFSYKVKEELEKHTSESRHCMIAEIAAIIQFAGTLNRSKEGSIELQISTENLFVIRKVFTLLSKTFNIETSEEPKDDTREKKASVYTVVIKKEEEILQILQSIKVLDIEGVLHELNHSVNPIILKQSCCQRAFLRGAFLTVGSISDPAKGYHLELVTSRRSQAEQLKEVLHSFDLDAKVIERKNHHVVYLKEGSNIVDFLNITEAHQALMEMENLRILKEMRNSINRRVNCETANIAKTVNAASKQIEDILFIQKNIGFATLPDNLRKMAEVRLEYPEATLKELGKYLNPPVGKSGVNHRLRKLSEIADLNR